jgi:hypothetical protein
MKTQYAIFRKTDPDRAGTFGQDIFDTYEKAEKIIEIFYINGTEWLEVRSREVTEWMKP